MHDASRGAMPLAPVHAAAVPPQAAAKRATVEVWIPGEDGGLDSIAQKTGGAVSTDPIVAAAYANGVKVLEYVKREFGRSSFDGRGGTLKLRVHAPDPSTGEKNANNAYWFDDEQRIWLGDGDGVMFAPLGNADDVMAHEFFHGVIDSEVKLRYVGQEGALHESFADVLATGVDGNWQIAEKVFTPHITGDALRDLSRLTNKDWRTFPTWNDEVHDMSEIPSHAAYLVGSKLGMPLMRQVWYTALTDHLRSNSGFAGARDATIAAARVLYGATSTQAQAVVDAWTAVGIDATTPKERPYVAAPFQSTLAAALVQPHAPRHLF
ncbi:MAG: M4 family metallopeptidase [Gaiellales bacterium]